MNHYRHIIWDWNGTLFDDAGLCLEIINLMLREREMPLVDEQQYQRAFTFPVKDFYRNVGFDFSLATFEVVAAQFMDIYDRRRYECRLQAGALDILHALAARGCTQSVLSAYEQVRLEEMIAFHKLNGFFSHLIGLNDYYSTGKVEQGRQHLAVLACCPAEVVLIGDSLHDAEVAEAMGIDCILVPSGHYSRERLLTANVPILDSVVDLIKLLPKASCCG